MFENNFKQNWLKILELNEKRRKSEKSGVDLGKIQIPFSSIDIDHGIFFFLLKKLYPKFVTDQQNIIDIIISDEEEDIIKIYLYQTHEAGIQESFQIISSKKIKFKKKITVNLNEFYEEIQEVFQKKYDINISIIRIFKEEAIRLLNKLSKNVSQLTVGMQIHALLKVLKTILFEDLIILYPESLIVDFTRNLLKLTENFSIKKILLFIFKILPSFDYSLIIQSNEFNLIAQISKLRDKHKKSKFNLKFHSLKDLDLKNGDKMTDVLIKKVYELLNIEKVIVINLKDLNKFISNLIELNFPLDQSEIELLFQILLFLYRKYNISWDQYPKPKIYHPMVQLLFRLFGFNLNLRKISHWAIPKFFLNLKNKYLGLKSKILVIFTNKSSKDDSNEKEVKLKSIIQNPVLMEFENRKLVKIVPVKKELIFNKKDSILLNQIRNELSRSYGFVSTVVKIDITLIRFLLKDFFFDLNKINIVTKIKTLKMLRDTGYFELYPEYPVIRYLKTARIFSFIKVMLSIFIDLHMF